MRERLICPFFNKNDDECDVGCGYISPHDVKMIITYCSARFADCMRFRELSGRRAPCRAEGKTGAMKEQSHRLPALSRTV